MKRQILIGVCVLLVVAAGIIAGRVRARPQVRTSMTALTLTSKFTDYGTDGSVLGAYTQVRRQYSDGRWTLNLEGGPKTYTSNGRINVSDLLTPGAYSAGARERGRQESQVLGYRVFIQKDPNGTEFWYCPELDTLLKEIEFSKDGKLLSVTEAVSVQLGEPE